MLGILSGSTPVIFLCEPKALEVHFYISETFLSFTLQERRPQIRRTAYMYSDVHISSRSSDGLII